MDTNFGPHLNISYHTPRAVNWVIFRLIALRRTANFRAFGKWLDMPGWWPKLVSTHFLTLEFGESRKIWAGLLYTFYHPYPRTLIYILQDKTASLQGGCRQRNSGGDMQNAMLIAPKYSSGGMTGTRLRY